MVLYKNVCTCNDRISTSIRMKWITRLQKFYNKFSIHIGIPCRKMHTSKASRQDILRPHINYTYGPQSDNPCLFASPGILVSHASLDGMVYQIPRAYREGFLAVCM